MIVIYKLLAVDDCHLTNVFQKNSRSSIGNFDLFFDTRRFYIFGIVVENIFQSLKIVDSPFRLQPSPLQPVGLLMLLHKEHWRIGSFLCLNSIGIEFDAYIILCCIG